MRIKIIAWKISDERTTPCSDIRSDVNSSRICSITFPTQSRYAFAELTRRMRPGERDGKGTERGRRPRVREMKDQKWERCIQKWNSLLAEHIIINEPERAEGSEEAEGARQVAAPTLPTPARDNAPYRAHLYGLYLPTRVYRTRGIFSSART